MTNRVVLITGASSGIGESTALNLGKNGFKVALAARRIDRLNDIAEEIRKQGGESLAVKLDLSDPDQINEAVRNLAEGYRVVFSLYMIEGYDHQEIAEILGISESTSKSQLNRAKKKLKEYLIQILVH